MAIKENYYGTTNNYEVWYFNRTGDLGAGTFGDGYGIRPTITISKDTLNNL